MNRIKVFTGLLIITTTISLAYMLGITEEIDISKTSAATSKITSEKIINFNKEKVLKKVFSKNKPPKAPATIIKKKEIKTVAKTDKDENIKDKKPIKEKFETNDEIVKEFGRLEKVILWNGKSYTGVVVNTDKTYTMVTTEGKVDILLKDIAKRIIIR